MSHAARFTVRGRVQGVGFRAFVRDEAESLDLKGEVWNCRDGAVEGVVESDSVEDLTAFAERLRHGPGRVDGVDWRPTSPQGSANFSIGYTR